MTVDNGKVNIHGKEYTTVAKRVQDFREEFMYRYSIETQVVERTDKDVVMKAIIRDIEVDNYPIVATGYAEEQRASSMINKTSALENCETSAIGRALAAFGFAGSEYASADEVANAIKNQTRPDAVSKTAGQTISQPPVTNTTSEKRDFTKPTDAQIKLITDLGKQLGSTEQDIVIQIGKLETVSQASNFIKNLQRIKDEKESRYHEENPNQ